MKPKAGFWPSLLSLTALGKHFWVLQHMHLPFGRVGEIQSLRPGFLSSLPLRETKKWRGHLCIHPRAFTDCPCLKGVVRLLRMQTRSFALNTANAFDKLWTSNHVLCEKTALTLVKIPMPLACLSKPMRFGVKEILAKVVDCHGFQKWLSGNFFPTGIRCSGNVVCIVLRCPMGQSTWLERQGPHSAVFKGSWSSVVGKGKEGPQKRKRGAQGVVQALSRGEVNGGGGWVSQWPTIVSGFYL